MKTFLVKSFEYIDCIDYVYVEIWAAESKEQIWNEKHPNTPIGFIPDFEPKEKTTKQMKCTIRVIKYILRKKTNG